MTYGERSLTAAEMLTTLDSQDEEFYTLDEIIFQTGLDVTEDEYDSMERLVEQSTNFIAWRN